MKKIIYIFLFCFVIICSLFVFHNDLFLTSDESIDLDKEDFENQNFEEVNIRNMQVVPWGNEVLGVNQKLNSNLGKKVKVAIVDSGINKSHMDLEGTVLKEFNVIRPNEAIVDDFGHGTAIAGIIAAKDNEIGIIGVAPNVELYDVKVLKENGRGEVEHFILAIDWCIEQGVDIMNISFGFQSENLELKKSIDKAIQSGIIVVASAGNTYGFGVDYPAKYQDVLSITAIDEDLKRASSSAKGKIDFAAPGVEVLTTNKDGGYSLFTGTSFATAYATGLIARLLEEKDLTRDELMKVLKELAVDIGEDGYDREYGYGLLKMKNEVE